MPSSLQSQEHSQSSSSSHISHSCHCSGKISDLCLRCCMLRCTCYSEINVCCCASPPGYFTRGYEKNACPGGTYQNAYGSVSCKPCNSDPSVLYNIHYRGLTLRSGARRPNADHAALVGGRSGMRQRRGWSRGGRHKANRFLLQPFSLPCPSRCRTPFIDLVPREARVP